MAVEAAPSFLWVETIPPPGAPLALGAEDSRYLTKVCRARAGEHLTLTDGRGALAQASVVRVGEPVELEIEEVERRERTKWATLLGGAPERGRADWMVEKLGELGVALFQPIDCERGRWSGAEARVERWRRLAIAALRQSRQCFLLEVREPVPLEEAVAALPQGTARHLAQEGGPSISKSGPFDSGPWVGLVGPAEGLTAGEIRLLENRGFTPMSLADSRLRTETAAVAWATWWAATSTSARSDPD